MTPPWSVRCACPASSMYLDTPRIDSLAVGPPTDRLVVAYKFEGSGGISITPSWTTIRHRGWQFSASVAILAHAWQCGTAVTEESLDGGITRAGEVVRVGPHVLRPSTPYTSSVHAFLRALGDVGFGGAPEPVGIDEDGRERLVFIEGDVPAPPYPDWSQSDEALASVARLLRGLHEALCMDLAGTGITSSMIYFGEVSSEYFEANPDSRQHIPAIGGWIPVSSPERCAEVVLGVVRRPRRVVFHPFQLRLMWWLAMLLPGPTRWLIARTGRRH